MLRRYLHWFFLILAILQLLYLAFAFGGLVRMAQVGDIVRAQAKRQTFFIQNYVLLSDVMIKLIPPLASPAIDYAENAFGHIRARINEESDSAIAQATQPYANVSHQFVMSARTIFPWWILATVIAWWRRPRDVHMVKSVKK